MTHALQFQQKMLSVQFSNYLQQTSYAAKHKIQMCFQQYVPHFKDRKCDNYHMCGIKGRMIKVSDIEARHITSTLATSTCDIIIMNNIITIIYICA